MSVHQREILSLPAYQLKTETAEQDVKTPINMKGSTHKPQRKPKKNGSNQVFSYQLGPREGNTRIVGKDSVSTNMSASLSMIFSHSEATNNTPSRTGKVSSSDGIVGSSIQGKRGDCFYLAEINAIRNTQGGQVILNNNIHKNRDGSVTVTLPGAIKIRQEYAAKGMKCEVTGTYHITAEAIAKAEKLAGKSFSKNDMDTICLEIALENYRAEMIRTNQINGNKETTGNFTAEGAVSQISSHDLLYGGQTYDAGFILTGKKSDVYYNGKKYDNVQRYTDGQYGYITKEEMLKQTTFANAGMHAKGVSEINNLGKEEKDLYNMLNKYQGHESEFAITCSVRVKKKGADGVTPQDAGHAITVVKITADTIYVSNPWHPDKIEPIPRKEFIQMAYGMSAMQVTKQQTTNSNIHNSMNTLHLVLGKLNSNQHGVKPPSKINPNKLNSLLHGINNVSHSNRRNVNINSLIQIINRATTSQLSNDDKIRLNRLLSSISTENTKGDINVEDFNYFYEKFMK